MAHTKRETSEELLSKQFEQLGNQDQQFHVIRQLIESKPLLATKHYLQFQNDTSLNLLKSTISKFQAFQKEIMGHFENLALWLIPLIDKQIADKAKLVNEIAPTPVPVNKEIAQFSTLNLEQQHNFLEKQLLQEMPFMQIQKYLSAQTVDSLKALDQPVRTIMSFGGSSKTNELAAAATLLRSTISAQLKSAEKMAELNARIASARAETPPQAQTSTTNILSASSPIAPPKPAQAPAPAPASTSGNAAAPAAKKS